MFGSDALELAIALSFLFALMSLIASSIREGIEARLKQRANDLLKGLQQMFDEDKTAQSIVAGGANSTTKEFYDHPLISSLFKGSFDENMQKTMSNLPSYVPSKTFVSAMIDIVLKAKPAGGEAAQQGTVAELRGAVGNIQNEQVKGVLLNVINNAENDIAKVRQGIGDWYDATMDRVSGWYQKKTQWFLFFIGLTMAGILNVDVITIASHLTTDKTLRAAVVAAAENGSANSQTLLGVKDYNELKQKLGSSGYPVGWSPMPQACTSADKSPCETHWSVYLFMSFGWLLTAFAIMLGAPFWFDVLNKFVQLRSSLKPKEEEKKKPATP